MSELVPYSAQKYVRESLFLYLLLGRDRGGTDSLQFYSSSHDNAKFVSGGGDRTVFLWDVTTGQTIRRIPGHSGRVNAVALNDDASVAISG